MRSLAVIAIFLTGSAAAQTPGFWLVGTAPGTTSSKTYSLSRDGSIAAGYSAYNGFPPAVPGFTWSVAGGRDDFGLAPGMPLQSPAYGLSNDGTAVVGYTTTLTTSARAYRRIGSGPLENLGPAGYDRGYARAVSGDGSIVVGHGESGSGGSVTGQAFRWTPQGGAQGLGWLPQLGPYSQADAISRDGSTIVGSSGAFAPAAFVWHESTGMQALSPPAGWSSAFSLARGASADGSIIVGQAEAPDTSIHMIRWTSAGPQDLGLGSAYAVSDDGSVVAGVTNVAALWTPSTGLVTLADYLAASGVGIPSGWTPKYIYAVSGDGRTFAGEAWSGSGSNTVIQGFVASVPAPASAVVFLTPALRWLRRRRAAD